MATRELANTSHYHWMEILACIIQVNLYALREHYTACVWVCTMELISDLSHCFSHMFTLVFLSDFCHFIRSPFVGFHVCVSVCDWRLIQEELKFWWSSLDVSSNMNKRKWQKWMKRKSDFRRHCESQLVCFRWILAMWMCVIAPINRYTICIGFVSDLFIYSLFLSLPLSRFPVTCSQSNSCVGYVFHTWKQDDCEASNNNNKKKECEKVRTCTGSWSFRGPTVNA